MSEVAAFVARAWDVGIGPDDHVALATLAVSDDDPARAMVAVFAALERLLAYEPAALPAPPGEPAAAVVHAAANVLVAIRAGDRAAIDRAVVALTTRLAALAADDPRAIPARAWADRALGEVALLVGDLRVAHHRFEAVAAPGRPPALRIGAMLQLVGLAIERADFEAARAWVRKAATLADTHDRPRDRDRARLLGGLLDYAVGDVAAMRASLGRAGPIERLVLATAEPAARAIPLFAEVLGAAVERRDPIVYMLCILLGARRYCVMGSDADAVATLEAGIAQLANVAPPLEKLLAEERRTWQATWSPARRAAAGLAPP